MASLQKWRAGALRAIALLVTAASLAAFAQSYRGLYYWSREHGLSGFWAAAWPIQLDAFIAVGELALFVALVDQWSRRARTMAWAVTLTGAAVSVAGNVGHVSGHDIASRLTAAVPPVAAAAALAVALGILKRVIQASAAPAVPESPAVPAAAPAPVPERARQERAPRSRSASRKHAASAKDPRSVFAAQLASGTLPTDREVRVRMGVGSVKASAIRADLERELAGVSPNGRDPGPGLSVAQ